MDSTILKVLVIVALEKNFAAGSHVFWRMPDDVQSADPGLTTPHPGVLIGIEKGLRCRPILFVKLHPTEAALLTALMFGTFLANRQEQQMGASALFSLSLRI